MKNKPLILIILCLLILTGCKTYLHFRYGVKQPGEETIQTLTDFLEKNHYPTRDQFCFRDSGSYCNAFRDTLFSKNLLSNMIFDRNGNLLQKDTAKCQWAGLDLITSLHPDSVYAITPGLKLEWILTNMIPLTSSADTNTMTPDFTVVVTWARFLGRYNYRLFNLADAQAGNPFARIRMVWLNVDMQKAWQLKKSQKPAIQ